MGLSCAARAGRSEKIADVRRFGSPNVFDQFHSHVSVGWASDESSVASAMAQLAYEPGATFRRADQDESGILGWCQWKPLHSYALLL